MLLLREGHGYFFAVPTNGFPAPGAGDLSNRTYERFEEGGGPARTKSALLSIDPRPAMNITDPRLFGGIMKRRWRISGWFFPAPSRISLVLGCLQDRGAGICAASVPLTGRPQEEYRKSSIVSPRCENRRSAACLEIISLISVQPNADLCCAVGLGVIGRIT